MTCAHPVREYDERGRPYCGVCGAMLDPVEVFAGP